MAPLRPRIRPYPTLQAKDPNRSRTPLHSKLILCLLINGAQVRHHTGIWLALVISHAAYQATSAQSQDEYCRGETPYVRSAGPYLMADSLCQYAFCDLHNAAKLNTSVYWVDTHGEEVYQFSVAPGQTAVFGLCRGHYWRARDRRSARLLSEYVPSGGPELLEWEIRGCQGFPLEAPYHLQVDLAGLGSLDVRAGTIGVSLSPMQHAAVSSGKDVRGEVELTLEEAYRGKTVSVDLPRRSVCPACHGLGAPSFRTCDQCTGSGVVIMTKPYVGDHPQTAVWNGMGDGVRSVRRVGCSQCSGTGRVEATQRRAPCGTCGGDRFITRHEKVSLPIPPGITSGHTTSFPGEGHVDVARLVTGAGRGSDKGEHGSFSLSVTVLEDHRFRRDGDDLYSSVHISLLEALEGFSRKFECLGGESIVIASQAPTLPGSSHRVAGRGMPLLGSPGTTGDLYIKVHISLPEDEIGADRMGFFASMLSQQGTATDQTSAPTSKQ